MTRAQIRKQMGLIMIEDPLVANRELTEDQARDYKRQMNAVLAEFEKMAAKKPQNEPGCQKTEKVMNELDR